MKIPFNKKWIVLEREDYANYLFVVSSWEGFTKLPSKWGFVNSHWLSAEYINKSANLFITVDDYNRDSSSYFESIFTKPKLWHKIHKEMHYYSDEIMRVSREIKKLNIRDLSNKELLKLRLEFEYNHQQAHDRRGVMFIVETFENKLTNYLHEYLSERINDLKIKDITPYYAFQVLTTPKQQSQVDKEHEKFIKIALIKDKEKQQKALARHAKEYAWLEYGLQGKILDLEYFKKELTSTKRRNPQKLFNKIKQDKKNLKAEQKRIMGRLNIHDQHGTIFKIARDAIFYKAYSKYAQFFGYWCIEDLLREIGKRAGLTLEQVKFLATPEYKDILLKGKDLSSLANKRMKYSLHFSDKGKTLFFTGDEAKKIRKKLKFITTSQTVKKGESIKGQPAFSGKAKGKVKIINTPQEMLKMHQGDVLVSHMTNPDIVPAMKKACAIVTDLGGITCHAAIVSRELKKPCVIGTKVATQVLRDGEMILVDAKKGIIKIIK